MFTSRNGFEFGPLNFPFYQHNSIRIMHGQHSVEEYVRYINTHSIDQAYIAMEDIGFLRECPTIQHVIVGPAYSTVKGFDFSPLYDLPHLKSLHCCNAAGMLDGFSIRPPLCVDFRHFSKLEVLGIDDNPGCLHWKALQTLKSLSVGDYRNAEGNLKGLYCSEQLDTLLMNLCKMKSLDGIEVSPKLQYLKLSYNRSLQDISALVKVKKSLKALRIQKCAKITDFSVLEELENLQNLSIDVSQSLPNIQFVRKLKNLKTLTIGGPITDGDLTPCLHVQHAVFLPMKKHYNLKENELPQFAPQDYRKVIRGNEDIEEWRRCE